MSIMKVRSLLFVSLLIPYLAYAADESRFPVKRNSIGSSLYLMGNLMFIELVYDLHFNYGYRLTPKDALIVEGFT
jgi:hypothetical protein